ncbi:DedA family protein [Luteococcus peritonei]|uniref:DedA family protein n=1 Tax=Luteococcus peritonei TaxID=88874 RepID=A0ABW4RVB9_9ACTN
MSEQWWNPMSWEAPFAAVAGALFVIVTLRAGATYAIGRLLRRGGEHSRGAQLMHRPGFVHATERLNRWGAPAVSLSFLTVGLQTMVNLAAGFTRMPLQRYLPALVVGCIAWACIYATAGFIGISAAVRLYQVHPALAWGLGLLVVSGLVLFWRSQRLAAPQPPTD